MKYWLDTVAIALLLWSLSGCSSREIYEPKQVAGEWDKISPLDDEIVDLTFDGAVLANGQVLTADGVIDKRFPEGYRFIGESDGWVIAGKSDGELLLTDKAGEREDIVFELRKTVAAASVQSDTLAVLFANNDKKIYSLSSKEPLFEEQGLPPVAVDNRIVNPYFLNELVLFLTLDGKIVIVDSNSGKTLRSIIVSSEEHFDNIIYFQVIGNSMLAATGSRILALADKEIREPYALRDMVYNDKGVWISTKEGEVIALTPSLQVKAKEKFQFAHFLGMIVTDEKVYLLEKEGYLIVLDSDLSHHEVYEIDLEDGFVFASDSAFYIADEQVDID